MKNNQGNEDLHNDRAFKDATWVLTDKRTGKVSEYNYSEMSGIVTEAYKGKTPDVIAKHLRLVGCEIVRMDDRKAESVNYSDILPEYTIDCYDWYYQCHHCGTVLDKIREKGQKALLGLLCSNCSW